MSASTLLSKPTPVRQAPASGPSAVTQRPPLRAIRPGLLAPAAWHDPAKAYGPFRASQQKQYSVPATSVSPSSSAALVSFDLVKGRSWPLRDQAVAPMCTAYATLACLELYHATGGAPIPHYSASFIYYFMRRLADGENFDGDTKGFTRFEDAQAVLQDEGYCDITAWDDNQTGAPTPNVLTVAAMHKTNKIAIGSFPPGANRPDDLAQRVYAELKQGRPVAIGMPAYNRQGQGDTNNWTAAFDRGVVQMPDAGDIIDKESGHAVCIVGFSTRDHTDVKQVEDGFFVFRNSLGLQFSTAPTTGWPAGYGLLPAQLVNQATWGLLFVQPGS